MGQDIVESKTTPKLSAKSSKSIYKRISWFEIFTLFTYPSAQQQIAAFNRWRGFGFRWVSMEQPVIF